MLTLNHLYAGYDNRNVLSDINLSVDPGQIYTIVGKNGCGKSTLLKTCAGLISPTSGELLLNGKDLTRYTPTERARTISYLSQTRNVPNITVERLITHGRFPHLGYPQTLRKDDWDVVDRAINLMQLDELRQTNLTSLSGGECQRVYLAMLLAQDAPILLLDEPNTYMDIEYQLYFLELLHRLKQSGKTIVMVLHDLEQALHYSDRIAVMDDGQIAQFAPPDEVINSGILTEVFHVEIAHKPYSFRPIN